MSSHDLQTPTLITLTCQCLKGAGLNSVKQQQPPPSRVVSAALAGIQYSEDVCEEISSSGGIPNQTYKRHLNNGGRGGALGLYRRRGRFG